MRISDPKPVERIRSGEDDGTVRAGQGPHGHGAAEPVDRVSISADEPAPKKADQEVKDASAAVRRELASSRSVHLASIEAAVRNGSYRPDPRVIAERILQSAALDAQIDATLREIP